MKNIHTNIKILLSIGCIISTVTFIGCNKKNTEKDIQNSKIAISEIKVNKNLNKSQDLECITNESKTEKENNTKNKPSSTKEISVHTENNNNIKHKNIKPIIKDKIQINNKKRVNMKKVSTKTKVDTVNLKLETKKDLKNDIKPIIKNNYELTYCNLVDVNTQTKIANILKKNNVHKKDIDIFLKCVKHFNNVVGNLKTNSNGFKGINTLQVKYDEGYIMDKWYTYSKDPVDLNCRLTAFRLFKDCFTSDNIYKGDTINLMFDLDAIERNSLYPLDKDEINKFINLYAAIPTVNTKDIKKHAAIIKEEFKRRDIKFLNNSNISLINGFLHYPEDSQVFSGHSGILIKSEDGFYFIEKYAFYMPYQVSKFNTKNEVKNYLLNRLDVEWGQESSKPIIMENDNLME